MNRKSYRVEASSGGGVGFLGLLAVLFIGLKLTGYIGWSWAWVLSPLWVPFVLGLGLCLCFMTAASVAFGTALLLDAWKNRGR